MTGEHVFEVSAGDFQTTVVERSLSVPILLDFWAEWCGPCKTLGPVLEQIADEYGGAFRLGKVDTEREQELAYAFQVQGIPFCVLVAGGKPVDAFQGVIREAEVRRFLGKNGVQPKAGTVPAAPAKIDPDSPAGRLQRALAAAQAGDMATADAALANFPEEDPLADRAARLRDGLQFLGASLNAAAPGVEGLLAKARSQLLQQQHEAAMESILAAVAADKGFRGGLPRRAMLLCFLLVGEDDERCDPYRRRLATLLY
ncbi:MAG TPA: tetratricopeptide repeat protein [Planctomycetota bacterium]|nr:tetratricopeptide repeat protein [Planctomycetota bacterium]